MNRSNVIWPLLVLLLNTSLLAQQGGRNTYQYLEDIQGDTLLVVLDTADTAYNEAIQVAMEDWTLHQHIKFVTGDAWMWLEPTASLAVSSPYSLLIRDASKRTVRRASGTINIRRNHICLYPYDYGNNIQGYSGKVAVAQFQAPNIKQTESFGYKLPLFLRSMQQYVSFLDTATYNEDTYALELDQFRNYQRAHIANQELLIEEGMLSTLSLEELKASYPYPVAEVSKDYLAATILAKADGQAILHLDPRKREMWIIQSDGTILYQVKLEERGQLTIDDFKKLAKAVETPMPTTLSVGEMVNLRIANPFKKKDKKEKENQK